MLALSREEISNAFEDEEDLKIPPLDEVAWDNLDYFSWIHPTGHQGFMVLQSPSTGEICGIRLNRRQRSAKRPRMEMCSWCHHVHRANGTAMFTVDVKGSDGRHVLGNVACKDLDCSLRVRNLVSPDSYMKETLYEPARIWRMQQSLHRWLSRAGHI